MSRSAHLRVIGAAAGIADARVEAAVPGPLLAPLYALRTLALLDLDAPVVRYWPEYGAHGKEKTTVRDVLTFRLGLGLDFTAPWPSPTMTALADSCIAAATDEAQRRAASLHGEPGADRLVVAALCCTAVFYLNFRFLLMRNNLSKLI